MMVNTGKKLKPGEPGTKKLVLEYGEKLLCVRYRYDAQRKRRMKTIELIIAEEPWQPSSRKIPSNKIMRIRVKYGEVDVGKQVRAAGGTWNRAKQVWELPYGEVRRLGLMERIVDERGHSQE
jgi:hypothetical protein